MKQTLIGWMTIVLLSTPLYAATTVKGNVNASTERVWSFMPFGDGQTLITLSWGKKSADLFFFLTCHTSAGPFDFGIGGAFQDRIQRVEAGVFGDLCEITVTSSKGGSSFRLSVESGVSDELTKAQRAGEGAATLLSRAKLQLIPMQTSDFPGLAEKIEYLRAARR